MKTAVRRKKRQIKSNRPKAISRPRLVKTERFIARHRLKRALTRRQFSIKSRTRIIAGSLRSMRLRRIRRLNTSGDGRRTVDR